MRPTLPAQFLADPIAHRGLHDKTQNRPENSPAAFRGAIAAGYPIEMDLQLSADGVAMVFHDDDLNRLTGQKGLVKARTAAELAQITLNHSTETIPTLKQVLALVAGRVPLLIELKDQHGQMGETDGRLEQATADALKYYNGTVALMSFNPHSVARLAILAPDLPRGITTSDYTPSSWPELPATLCDHLREIPDYDRADCCFISHEARDLARPRVAQLQAQGATILCWTIRSPEAEAKARKIAANITFEGYLAAHPA
jgi:glycerophosphoryl diester phosphodiesterase